MPEFRSDKGMIRGDVDVKSATNAPIACVKWLDNKSVHIISSCDSGMSTTNVTRRKKGQSDKINIKCPTVVKSYNENMDGVDKHDRLKVAYEVDRRSKTRFYLCIIFDMMDQLLVNANILYNSLDKVQKMSSREFRLHVVRALCEESKCRKRSTKVCDTQAQRKTGYRPTIWNRQRYPICQPTVTVEDVLYAKLKSLTEKQGLNVAM